MGFFSKSNKQSETKTGATVIAQGTYIIGGIEGEKRKAIEIARKSLEQNIDLETIKIITGLTDIDLSNLTNTYIN